LIGKVLTAALAVVLTCFAGVAAAGTGGAPTAVGGPPPRPSATGAPAAGTPSAGALSLLSATTTPRRSFYYGVRYPSLRFAITSTQAQNDIRVDIVDAAGEVVRTFFRNDVSPDTELQIRWDGTKADGRPARTGRYSFRIGAQAPGAQIARRAAPAGKPLGLSFEMYGYAFPLLGRHNYGGAGAVFGAGRSGHTHQGHDVMAECGLPIVAARGGQVQYSGYQGAAGNYVVIDGKGTGYDTAYMHLLQPSPLREGDRVRTGQPIGLVGSTGSSTACHLHFEMWGAPGWYEGGSPIDPLPYLKWWDTYS
jgi:murein DD-endopeptidase MepM/ murein hydrolase activator NlpD